MDACPAPAIPAGTRFDGGELAVSRPVMFKGRRLGTLVLLYDLGEITERIKLYGASVLAVLIASSFIAFLLSSRLREFIANPISRLAQTSAMISETRDYGIRAESSQMTNSGC